MSDDVTGEVLECPVCGEELLFTPDDLETLGPGDVIACDACATEMEVVGTDPWEFALLGAVTTCPKCGFELDVEDTAIEGEAITCPECGNVFEVRFDDTDPDARESL